ncbi:MAG TPA: hypothetical protein VFF40_09320 [Acidimicrobiia bacterium]|nr:hypothetical protein [Acidimicrobiia bacterium]
MTETLAAELWFFWLAPLFLLACVGVAGLVALSYYRRVIKVKRGG